MKNKKTITCMNTVVNSTKIAFLVILLSVGVTSNVFAGSLSTSIETVVSFSAKTQALQINLSWDLIKASDCKTYIHRAVLDIQFETVRQVQDTQDGQFEDKQPQSGIWFYRLVTYQEDGTVIYHKTITATK